MVLKLLLEGNSVSSLERITEVHHTTRSLRVTPATAAGISDHIWAIAELLG